MRQSWRHWAEQFPIGSGSSWPIHHPAIVRWRAESGLPPCGCAGTWKVAHPAGCANGRSRARAEKTLPGKRGRSDRPSCQEHTLPIQPTERRYPLARHAGWFMRARCSNLCFSKSTTERGLGFAPRRRKASQEPSRTSWTPALVIHMEFRVALRPRDDSGWRGTR